jgi:hypothetical protein
MHLHLYPQSNKTPHTPQQIFTDRNTSIVMTLKKLLSIAFLYFKVRQLLVGTSFKKNKPKSYIFVLFETFLVGFATLDNTHSKKNTQFDSVF